MLPRARLRESHEVLELLDVVELVLLLGRDLFALLTSDQFRHTLAHGVAGAEGDQRVRAPAGKKVDALFVRFRLEHGPGPSSRSVSSIGPRDWRAKSRPSSGPLLPHPTRQLLGSFAGASDTASHPASSCADLALQPSGKQR